MRSSVFVKQQDKSDCGAACLVSVAAYFGSKISVSRVRRFAGTGKEGTSLQGMMLAAEKIQLQTRAVQATSIRPDQIPVPSICHLLLENGYQHFVVLYEIRKQGIRIMDPATGKIINRSFTVFRKQWTGVILLVTPTQSFRKENLKSPFFRRIKNLLSAHWKTLAWAIVGAVFYALMGMAISVYIKKLIDEVLPNRNLTFLNVLSEFMIALVILKAFVGFLKSKITIKSGMQMDYRLIMDYYRHLLKLPQDFFDQMRFGEIISRVNDAVKIRLFVNETLVQLFVSLISVLLSFSLLVWYSFKLAMLLLLSLPVFWLIYYFTNKTNARWQRKIMEQAAEMESHLVETIQGVRTIRRFGSEDLFVSGMEKYLFNVLRSIRSGGISSVRWLGVSEGFTGLMMILILWYGSFLMIGGSLSIGELLFIFTLLLFFISPFQLIITCNQRLQDARIAADRLFEIMELETEQEINPDQEEKEFPTGDLLFDDVYFSYGNREPVFTALNLNIRHQKITGIGGETGCGKSTLVALIQKMYTAQKGTIQIGGHDIRGLSTRLLRKKITAVPQHTDLFQGDYIINITLGEVNPDIGRIIGICRRLGIHEFICQQPSGYQTVIREQGINLSGGQKQKLGIARAIYKNPDLLILDEATASLDPESELQVLDTISWFHQLGKTVLIITHRTRPLSICHSVIQLKQSKPVVLIEAGEGL